MLPDQTSQLEKLLSFNLYPEKTPFILEGIKSFERLNIFEFDHALFKTPYPNKDLFNSNTINDLLTSDHSKSPLNWYDNGNILINCDYTQENYITENYNELWNPELVSLFKLDGSDPKVLNVVFVKRNEICGELIKVICDLKDIEIDCLIVEDGVKDPSYLEWLITTFDSTGEFADISLYSLEQRDFSKAEISAPLYQIKVPFQKVYLNPIREMNIIRAMIKSHNLISPKNPLEIRKSVFWLQYELTLESRRELIREFEHCIPQDLIGSELQFDAEGIVAVMNIAPVKKLKALGGIGAKVTFSTAFFGYIENEIYAIKLLSNDEDIETVLSEPILVFARNKKTKLKRTEEITNWEVTDKIVLFDTVLNYKDIYKIAKQP